MSTLLFVNERYPPDYASAGQHLSDLTEFLAARGWRVAVVTGSSGSDGGQLAVPRREQRNGVTVHRLRTLGLGRVSSLGRVIDAMLFYLQLLPYLLWVGRPGSDTRVVCLTSPPMVAVIGWIARLCGGPRYGIWSLDLHPEAEMAAGMLAPRGPLGRALCALSAIAYRRADFVIAIGSYMSAKISAYGVPSRCLHLIPVWAEGSDVPSARGTGSEWPTQLAERFVVMYSGNAGVAHDFPIILDAMRQLRDEKRLFFLFVGSGPRRAAIEAYVREHGIHAYAYLPYVERDAVPATLSAAQAHLVSLRPEFVGIAVPGKTFGVMAVGRPIIFVGAEQCEIADVVRGARCGEIVDPRSTGASDHLVNIIRHWLAHPEEAREAGARGQAVWRSKYRRDPNCSAIETVIREAWS